MDQPGSVMVAVGAGHLAGEGSVLQALERQGYTVSRILPLSARLAAQSACLPSRPSLGGALARPMVIPGGVGGVIS